MKGCELTASRPLGIIAPPRVQHECDELVRLIGRAIGDHEIPPPTLTAIGTAIGIIVMYPDSEGYSAAAVRVGSEERYVTHPVIADVRAALACLHGWDIADQVLQGTFDIGQAIFTALGDRHVPYDACDWLAQVAADVAEHAAGVSVWS